MISRFVFTTDHADREPRGQLGKPVTAFYKQITAYLGSQLNKDATQFLAEPVRADDGQSTSWFIQANSDAIPLADLEPVEREKALKKITTFLSSASEAIENDPDGDENIQELVRHIVSDPDEQDVYVADDNVFIINWGYEPPTDFVPLRNLMKGIKGSENASDDKSSKKMQEEKEPNFRGLEKSFYSISILTLCMIFAISLASLFGVLRFFDVIKTASSFSQSAQNSNALSGLDAQRRENDRLRVEIDDLQNQLLAQVISCAEECSRNFKQPTPRTPPPTPKDEELTIPDEAIDENDYTFLKGKWESEAGLIAEDTKKPVIIIYEFNSDGTGKRTITIDKKTKCFGNIKAEFKNKKSLQILETDRAKCEDGVDSFTPYKVTCDITPSGKAECEMQALEGENKDKSLSTTLRRLK